MTAPRVVLEDQTDKLLDLAYDSWSAFIDHAEHGKATVSKPRSHREVWEEMPLSWYGGASRPVAFSLARDGWPEGEDYIKPLTLALVDKVSSLIERPVYIYDVEGHGIDVARYVDGEPECWLRQDVRITEGPGRRIVRIVANGFASCGIEPDVIRAKGAAVAALAELLELAGVRRRPVHQLLQHRPQWRQQRKRRSAERGRPAA